MARDGSGVYTLPAGNPVTTLTAITTSWANTTLSDLATELTNSIDKGGRTAITANLPMAGFKHTGAGAGSASGQYLLYGQASASLTDLALTRSSGGNAFVMSGAGTNALYQQLANTGGNTFFGISSSAGGGLIAGLTTYASAIVTESARDLALGTSSTLRLLINGTTGAAALSAPSGGHTLTLNHTAGSGTGSINTTDGTVIGVLKTVAATSLNLNVVSAHSLTLGTSDTTRVTVNSSGAITINAPSAGVGLTQNGFAGSDTAVLNGGTSGSFRVNTTGVPYGTSLHNNAGAVTGATNQYICSGTYTPTAANFTNITANTPQVAQWLRVGNVVTVSGSISVTTTAASPTQSLFTLTLPIASTLSTFNKLIGVLSVSISGSINSATLSADTVGNLAQFSFASTTTGAQTVAYVYTYLVS